MGRVEELVMRLLDGELDSQESEELQALVAQPAGFLEAMALLRLEAALRARRRNLDLSAATIERLRGGLQGSLNPENLRDMVLEEIANEPAPAWKSRGRRNRLLVRSAYVFATMAIAALVVAGVLFRKRPRDTDSVPAVADSTYRNPAIDPSPIPTGTTDLPVFWTNSAWPNESTHRVHKS